MTADVLALVGGFALGFLLARVTRRRRPPIVLAVRPRARPRIHRFTPGVNASKGTAR